MELTSGMNDYFKSTIYRNFRGDQVSQEYVKPTLGDGILEICGLKDIFDFLGAKMSLSHSTRLSQGSSLCIDIISDQAFLQVDGESYVLEKGTQVTFSLEEKVRFVKGPKDTINTN
jgi:hypothetical protein